MAMIKKSATGQKMGQTTTASATTNPPDTSPFAVKQEHIDMASKDKYISNLFGEKAPDYFAAGIKLTNVGGGNQPLFIMPSSSTQIKGGGQVAFRQNKDGKTFEMVTVGKDSKGNVTVSPTDGGSFTGADMINKFGSLVRSMSATVENTLKTGGQLQTSAGAINIPKGSTGAAVTESELRTKKVTEMRKANK